MTGDKPTHESTTRHDHQRMDQSLPKSQSSTKLQHSSSPCSGNDRNAAKEIKRRSSKACDNCRKSKCKCTRAPGPDGLTPSTQPCQNCLASGLECTFNGSSRKRGPPKGYIEAIESRLHRMEAFLGGLLENDDPRAQALFSELVRDNEVGELLQNDFKLSAQSPSNSACRKSWKLFDSTVTNTSTFLDHKIKPEITDTQKALWGVHSNQLASIKDHCCEDSNKLGALSSDLDDDSECENDPPDRSPPIHDTQLHHHRTRRRRLGAHPSALPRRSRLSIPAFRTSPSNATIPHTATATFTLTQPESVNTSQDFFCLNDSNAMQTVKSPTKQHSPATISELADVVGQLSLDENDEVRYHGRSSGLYLISASQRYKNFFWHFPKPGFWPVAPIRRSHSTLDIFELVNPLEVIPNREMMNHLLDFFWAFVHPMIPVLYKAEFLSQFQNLMKNLDKVKQARPHWTQNQVWCHALSGSSLINDASPSDSSYHYSPSPPIEQLEPPMTGLKPTNRISILLLLVIFAISSRYSNRSSSPPVEGQYWNAGDKYFAKAKQILNLDYGNSKLTNCQSIILMAYREIGAGAMGESWLYTGMAIRMAQDMGLFRDVDKWFMPVKRFKYEEKQIRKRVWWACINMDKYVSTYIGRPMMIFERDYDTALPSTDEPDEHEQWIGWSPDGQRIDALRPTNLNYASSMPEAVHNHEKLTEEKKDSSILDQKSLTNGDSAASTHEKSYTISCFSRSASLSVLLSRIVANIYAIRVRVIGQSSETLLSLLDQNLARWYLHLPEHLQYNPQPVLQTINKSSSAGFGSPKRALTPHLLTLHAQFYTALILLHRPFIPASHPQANISSRPIDCPPSFPSHTICTTAANAITSIAQAYSQHFGLRQAPVFLVYYIFTAAILHVYNASSDAGLAVTAKTNLLKCMNCLKEMAPTWTGAVRAWELLVGLVDLRDHDESDNRQHQNSVSPMNTSDLDSHGHQKVTQVEDRRLKRTASASNLEDQMKHFLPGISNPYTSPSHSNTDDTKPFHAAFDHPQPHLDWIASQNVAQSKLSATQETAKPVRAVSDLGPSVTADANATDKMDTFSTNDTALQQDIRLLQSRTSDYKVSDPHETRLSACINEGGNGFELRTPKYSTKALNSGVPSSLKNDGNHPVHDSRSGCEYAYPRMDKEYFSAEATLPTTALEGMIRLTNLSGHLHDYHHQQSLQTSAPPPPRSQFQSSQQQQQFQSPINQGLSGFTFDTNSFTSSQTISQYPCGTSNNPETSAKTIQGILGLGGSVPQLGKFIAEGTVRPQQNRMVFGNPDGAGYQLDSERQCHQERTRASPSMILKNDVTLDEIFPDSGLNWFPLPNDSVGEYGIDPNGRISGNSQSQLLPHTTNPYHPTHPLHDYYNYNLGRNNHYKSSNVNSNGGTIHY